MKDIHDMVTQVKRNAEVSREYMKWAEIQRMWKQEGYDEGIQNGIALEFQNTVMRLLGKGMTETEIAQLLDRDIEEIRVSIIEE